MTSSVNPRLFFSKEMYDEIEETFKMLDTENTGVINKQQLLKALQVFGAADNEALLNKTMSDLSEFIDFDEFIFTSCPHE